jgi:hypothetical protein
VGSQIGELGPHLLRRRVVVGGEGEPVQTWLTGCRRIVFRFSGFANLGSPR